MTPAFLLTALVVCLAPGIGVVYTLSTALGRGLRAGLWAVVGCTLATAVHLGFALAGLAAVLETSALVFAGVKYAGAAYLMWLAWSTLQGGGTLKVDPDRRAHSPWQLVQRGLLLNILNPKLPIFFLAFLPQFIPAGAAHPTALLVELGLGFVGMTFGVFVLYAAAAGWLRSRIVESPRAMAWMRRAFAASFAGLGLKLALERA